MEGQKQEPLETDPHTYIEIWYVTKTRSLGNPGAPVNVAERRDFSGTGGGCG
jgi:hypothetical protein